MRRIGWLGVIGVMLLCVIASVQAETIKMSYFELPPFQMATPEGPQGATIAYVKMLAAKASDTIQWEGPLPLMRVNLLLESGLLDANSICIKIPQLESLVAFTDQPYFATQGVFMVRATNPLQQITAIADTKGYRVAWLSGAEPSAFVKEHLADLDMQYLTPNATQAERSILKLLAGQVDAVHEMNQFALEYQARLMGVQNQVKTLILPEPAMPIHVGFAKKAPRTPQLLERYNQAQKELNFTQDDFRKLMQHFLDNVKPVK